MNNLYTVKYNSNKLTPEITHFVQENHYSGSVRSQQQVHIFTLHNLHGKLVGVCIYGKSISRNSDSKAIELRRFCLDNSCVKNTASFFLSRTITWLKKFEPKYNHIVTYADPNKGHQGTMYKASNFIYDGLERNNPRVVLYQGREYHLRQYYQKRNNEYDTVALELQAAVRNGEAQIIPQKRKHRFIYKLR